MCWRSGGLDECPQIRVDLLGVGGRTNRRSRDCNGAATDPHFGPMMFGLAHCDHVVLYRFTPRAACATGLT
jgi:hypothetical protein